MDGWVAMNYMLLTPHTVAIFNSTEPAPERLYYPSPRTQLRVPVVRGGPSAVSRPRVFKLLHRGAMMAVYEEVEP